MQGETKRSGTSLKVFVPLVHAARAGGIARSLIRAGHSMYINAPDSIALTEYDVGMAQGDAQAVWGPNVFCYSGRQILADPPDVIIVGVEPLEPAMFDLHARLSVFKPVVLCAISGNYQSHFTWPAYRGTLCADEPSRALSRYNDVPALRYYELFDPASMPYKAWTPTAPLVLPVLVKGIRTRFAFAADYCDLCADRFHREFGDLARIEIFDAAPLHEAWAAMEAAPAVLAIKDQEGYGWAMLEALSMGRPILYQHGLLRGMEFHKWTEPGVSGIGFATPDDLVAIARDILADPEQWQARQHQTAAIFRERYDGAATADDMNAFLSHLVQLEALRWHPARPAREARERPTPYRPTLDPAERQDWERVTNTPVGKSDVGSIPFGKMGAQAFVAGWQIHSHAASSSGQAILDLSHLSLRAGAMLSVIHHRAKPVHVTIFGENDDVLVALSLPLGSSRITVPAEAEHGPLRIVSETWSPRVEFGSADPRTLSFDIVGIEYPGN